MLQQSLDQAEAVNPADHARKADAFPFPLYASHNLPSIGDLCDANAALFQLASRDFQLELRVDGIDVD
jgi:hypothetical protein